MQHIFLYAWLTGRAIFYKVKFYSYTVVDGSSVREELGQGGDSSVRAGKVGDLAQLEWGVVLWSGSKLSRDRA
jgi:hypothetical protein